MLSDLTPTEAYNLIASDLYREVLPAAIESERGQRFIGRVMAAVKLAWSNQDPLRLFVLKDMTEFRWWRDNRLLGTWATIEAPIVEYFRLHIALFLASHPAA